MELIQDITILFSVACILGVLTSFLKLPIVIAYLATGLVIGPIGLNLIPFDSGSFEGLSNLGIAFMLFLVGLELNINKIKALGWSLFTVALSQIIFTGLFGYIIASLLGYGLVSSVYIAIALVFSSTVFVIKILSDTNQITSLHGRMLVGILLIQDFIAIGALIVFQSISGIGGDTSKLINTGVYILIFLLSAYLLRKYLIGYIFNLFSRSPELLFVASIAWALVLSYISNELGFSIAIGAFIAGLTLAPLIYSDEIRGKIRWLRDFFIIIFLSLIGASFAGSTTDKSILTIIILSLFVLIAKPLIILITMGLGGFRRRTSFLTGIYCSQLSEFSLILVALGLQLNHINQEVGTVIVFVTIISISISSIVIDKANFIYHKLLNVLKIFERKGHFNDDFHCVPKKMENHVVLFGAHRIGSPVLEKLKHIGQDMLVVDFDPFVIKRLHHDEIPSLYGDMGDPELVDELNLSKAKMIISTSHDNFDTLGMLKKIKNSRSRAYIFVTGSTAEEALEYYKSGADYVILPHYISGDYLAELIDNIQEKAPITTQRHFESLRIKHIKDLEKSVEKLAHSLN